MQKKKTLSFDRKLVLTFVTALFLVVPGVVAATVSARSAPPDREVAATHTVP